MNWPIRNTSQIQNYYFLLIDNTIMWSPSFFFISNRFYRTLNNFVPLNGHIITEFSWVVTMAPVVLSADILRWTVTSHWHRQFRRISNSIEICLVGRAPGCWSHRRSIHGSNFLTAVTYSTQSNSKLYVQKNNYVPNAPVELAHYLNESRVYLNSHRISIKIENSWNGLQVHFHRTSLGGKVHMTNSTTCSPVEMIYN